MQFLILTERREAPPRESLVEIMDALDQWVDSNSGKIESVWAIPSMAMIPVPIGFVSTSTWPGSAAAFVMRSEIGM